MVARRSAALLFLLLAACARKAAMVSTALPATSVPRAPVPTSVASVDPPPAPADPLPSASEDPAPVTPGPLTLAFAGDVHFTGRTAKLLSQPETALGPLAEVLRSADFAMLNLETAVTERTTAQPKQWLFRAPSTAFDAVRAAGVDVVTMANNHVLDYGRPGLADALESGRRASVPIVGVGRDAAEAFRPYYTTIKGVKIGIVAFSQVPELEASWAAGEKRSGVAMARDAKRAVAAVAAARAGADLVVVFNHWGNEGTSCPTTEQKAFASRLAAAGADLIIGSHAHTLQGAGWLGRTFVAYGLANFVWWMDSHSTETGVLRLTMSGRKVARMELVPAVVSDTGQPVPLEGDAALKLKLRFLGLRACSGLAAEPSE